MTGVGWHATTRGEHPQRVELRRSGARAGMTANGASLSCQMIAAKVGNQHPILPFENRE
jgi:hypothetical protein